MLHLIVGLLLGAGGLQASPIPHKQPHSIQAGGSEGNVSVEGVRGVLGDILQQHVDLGGVGHGFSPSKASILSLLWFPLVLFVLFQVSV